MIVSTENWSTEYISQHKNYSRGENENKASRKT